MLALQGEMARTIASEIELRLTPQQEGRLKNPRPVTPQAYEAYLKVGSSEQAQQSNRKEYRLLHGSDSTRSWIRASLRGAGGGTHHELRCARRSVHSRIGAESQISRGEGCRTR